MTLNKTASLLIIAAWCVYLIMPTTLLSGFTIWVLSVGQGESVLIRARSGHTLLYDGGPDTSVLSELGNILPPWVRTITAVALSHTHADHIAGLIPVLERYHVDMVFLSGATDTTPVWNLWSAQLQKTEQKILTNTQRVSLGTLAIQAITPTQCTAQQTPKSAHDCTLLLNVADGGHSILLTGDLDARHLPWVLDQCRNPHCSLRATILQIPHHGAGGATSRNLLAAVTPAITLIPVGQNNKYNHPHPDTIALLAALPIWRTDLHGRIMITCQSECRVSPQVWPP